MKTYNHLFSDKEKLRTFAEVNDLDPGKRYLIRIHTSVHRTEQISELTAAVKEVFPESPIAGTSVTSVIHNGIITENACLISVTVFDSTEFETQIIHTKDRDISFALEKTGEIFKKGNTKAAAVVFTSLFADIRTYLDSLRKDHPQLVLTGGISGITPQQMFVPFIFDENGVCTDGVLAIAFRGDALKVYGNVIQGHEAVGDVYTITKVTGNTIDEIEGVRASEWIREFFGETDAVPGSHELDEAMSEILLRFPLVFEDRNGSNAFLRYDPETDGIVIAQNISAGMQFRLGYISSSSSVLDCRRVCGELENESVETLFTYSCMLRKQLMSGYSTWEMSPFVNTDISGGFLCGEIACVNGTNTFYNGTGTILAMSEKPASVRIEHSAFRHMENLKEEKRELLDYVLKMQSESIIRKNKLLSQQIMEHEEKSTRELFLDEQTGLNDISKFAFDNEEGRFTNACMISVEKGDVLRSYYGSTDFRYIILRDLELISEYFNKADFSYYMYNKHTIVIVADRDFDKMRFRKTVRKFYLECGHFTVEKLGITCINSVSVAVDENEKLIEKAATALIKGEKTGLRYNIYKPAPGAALQLEEQIRLVKVISEAIAESRVIPYFQPIYSNITGNVTKFESLARIADREGNIYPPGVFMQIAKEFRLYHQLSGQMITKVFSLFDRRNETVSVNISAYDINSVEMKEKIYSQIRKLKKPQNFIFEIVESEEFQDFDVLFDFVKTVGRYGIKIAIDDFGSGYSNLVEIAKLEPDFIKIDGEIIRNINVSSIHRAIAETAVHMADSLGIELIAEYVENAELQNTLVGMNVEYSQGYLFSKPMPYDDIDRYLEIFSN